ncbi:hypothetical protein G6F55_013452 [Rhizopus delemar]|nr:hypothetical protein G6F55_013452 [Rhizopus delemar]
MDATPRRAQYGSNTHSHNRNYSQQSNHLSQQQELVDLIQRTIRSELDNQRQQYNRNYGRNNRNNYSNNNYSNDRYGRPNNNYNNRYNSRADDNYNNQQQGSNQNQQPKN